MVAERAGTTPNNQHPTTNIQRGEKIDEASRLSVPFSLFSLLIIHFIAFFIPTLRPTLRRLHFVELLSRSSALLHCPRASVFAPTLCALILGPEFVDAVALVRLLGLGIVLSGVGGVYVLTLLAANRERLVLLLDAGVAVAVVAVNFVAFSIWPVPQAAAGMVGVMALHILALAYFCHAGGLVGRGSFDLRRLGPSEIGAFLRAR